MGKPIQLEGSRAAVGMGSSIFIFRHSLQTKITDNGKHLIFTYKRFVSYAITNSSALQNANPKGSLRWMSGQREAGRGAEVMGIRQWHLNVSSQHWLVKSMEICTFMHCIQSGASSAGAFRSESCVLTVFWRINITRYALLAAEMLYNHAYWRCSWTARHNWLLVMNGQFS